MPKTIIYPGTFDPITNGHVDIINRAVTVFDKVIIAVSNDTAKKTLLSLEERIYLIKSVFENSVIITGFEGLLVEFAKKMHCRLILRGIRGCADLEYEQNLSRMNKALYPDLETVFMMASSHYSHVSSRLVKDVLRLKGDISEFVPKSVCEKLWH